MYPHLKFSLKNLVVCVNSWVLDVGIHVNGAEFQPDPQSHFKHSFFFFISFSFYTHTHTYTSILEKGRKKKKERERK